MDIPIKRAAIRVRLDKARDDLATARHDLSASRWRGAVNRAYYAIFHEQDYLDLTRPLDEATAAQIVNDAERFVTRPERYLHEVGAIE